ncbi:MAG: YcgN family cysteine cluster protein [Qipengyuania sp.]
MGALRERFWELPLRELTHEEWEALCDGCGRCCLHKLEHEDTGRIEGTNVACRLLDCESASCADYANRKAFVPDCLTLTKATAGDLPWLPRTCAYRLRAAGKPLYEWHYLVSGDREAVIRAGVSVAGRVVSEVESGPLEHHIVEWDDD